MKKVFFLLLIAALLLTGCDGLKNPGAAETPEAVIASTSVRLPVGYIPNVQFAPLYTAIEKGFFRHQGIEVTMDYNMETDIVALVASNDIPFAVVSGEQVLLARGQGLPVVYVMNWYHNYPVGVMAKSGQEIRTPASLKGKKIGLPGRFGTSYIGLLALLDSAGLTEGDVTLDSIGFNQIESLVSDLDQAVVIYLANEPQVLAQKGYDVDVIAVSDYVPLVGNGLITNEQVLKENPDLVRRMVKAVRQGIDYDIEHPEEAYQISLKYVEGLAEADQALQQNILNASIGLWKSDTPGRTERSAWKQMQDILLKSGLMKKSVNLDDVFSNEYLPK